MVQKHFMDIENLRETDTDLRQSNAGAFEVGDLIQITEKVDGSNACVAYDSETDSLVAFSRKQELSWNNTLEGFWNYVRTLNKEPFKAYPNYRVFGEWLRKNKILYRPECMKIWYVYDIYDVDKEQYLPQSEVKAFCKEANLTYVHVLYEGSFVSWEHCKSFCHNPAYGDVQEGCVVKNESKLDSKDNKQPFYLKIVNESFKETQKVKTVDLEKEAEKTKAYTLAESIVTKNRVEKELYKMRDEQMIPEKLEPKDMKLVAKALPQRIYADCVKEEVEVVEACGEHFGKACSSLSMKYAREIILGE